MTCNEKKQACLNYSAGVPEWTLTMQLGAIQALSACASTLTDIVQALTDGMVYDRCEHPYAGDNDRPDFSREFKDSGYQIGRAVYALEVLAAENPFSDTRSPTMEAEAAYTVEHGTLENRCRKHGMEIERQHG